MNKLSVGLLLTVLCVIFGNAIAPAEAAKHKHHARHHNHHRQHTAGFAETDDGNFGMASWYGHHFQGRRTANGEHYDMYALTAAHKTLPLSSYAEVTNLHNQRSVIVRINDRGPYHHRRVMDLSYAAARELGIHRSGTAAIKITPLALNQAFQ